MTTTVKAVIEGDKCAEFGDDGNGQKGETQPIIAIVATVVLVSLLIMVIIICQCYLKNKRVEAMQTDENPVYEGAPDYEYIDLTNYNDTGPTTNRRREVKAEVVDRSSVYGEMEEGDWEDAVAKDNNPYYEA